MGACEFEVTVKGKTAQEAFAKVVEHAQYENGHGGYSGTIAEKHSFKLISSVATLAEARDLVGQLMANDDSRICDKWGPAGCVAVTGQETYIFFGWASS